MQGAKDNVKGLVGINMGFVSTRKFSATSNPNSESERICRRFYAALVLLDLIHEARTLLDESAEPSLTCMMRPSVAHSVLVRHP